MPQPEVPLTIERILAAAEDVVRRHGPDKATVSDVARALGVSHAAVHKHVGTKSELRDLVVSRWMEVMMPELRVIAAEGRAQAPRRLRRLMDELIAFKRSRSKEDPQLFAAYRTLALGAHDAVAVHINELISLIASVIRSGIEEGTMRKQDPTVAARAVLLATSRFHHPLHADEWSDPKIDVAFNDVWRLLMHGLVIQ